MLTPEYEIVRNTEKMLQKLNKVALHGRVL